MTDTPKPDKAPANEAPTPESTLPPKVEMPRLDPTRYGDWELKGKCVDF